MSNADRLAAALVSLAESVAVWGAGHHRVVVWERRIALLAGR